MQPSVQVETLSKGRKIFHTNVEILTRTSTVSFPADVTYQRNELIKEYGAPIGKMVYDLVNSAGVHYVILKSYEVDVNMLEGENWNEHIDPIVENAIFNEFVSQIGPLGRKMISVLYSNNRTIRQFKNTGLFQNIVKLNRHPDETKLGIGEPVESIIFQILKIPGVNSVYTAHGVMNVEIAWLFDWTEIEPQIKRVFDDILGPSVAFIHE